MSSPAAAPPKKPSSGSVSSSARTGGLVLLWGAVAIAVVIGVLAAVFTGAGSKQQLLDPGAVVRWGIVIFKPVADVAMAATIGLTGLGAFVIPEGAKTARVARAGRAAAIAATVWFLATVVVGYLKYGQIAGIAFGSKGYTSQWWTNTWELEILRNPALTALGALVIAAACWWGATRISLAWMTFLGLLSLWPIALSGHAAGSADHEKAVDSLIMHLVPVTLWVGGLIGLGMLWGRLGKGAAASVRRYSTVATWCIGFVAFSGVLAATLRIRTWGEIFNSRYGLVLVAKFLCLLVLGAMGLVQRRKVIDVLERDASDTPSKALFARLAAIEIVIMGVTMGLAATLSSSAPPGGEAAQSTDPVEALTGYPAPPPFSVSEFFVQWRIEWLMTVVALLAIVQYVRWVVRLQRRGDSWPIHRTILWVLAWLLFIWSIDGGAGVYGRVMMSAHMTGHMIISMTVPILLVVGAPITLMLRAFAKRQDGTRGPREVLLSTVHSSYMQVLANPAFAGALFFLSLIAFYYTPIFDLALRTHTGHLLMNVHFLWSGYLWAWSLIGIDPGPKKWPAPVRLFILLITITAHAFFGVTMMTGTTLLAGDYFRTLNFVSDPVHDQQAAGTITWGVSELPSFILAMIVAVQWARADKIEGDRAARRAERDDDAELKAYNAHLAALSGRRPADDAGAQTKSDTVETTGSAPSTEE